MLNSPKQLFLLVLLGALFVRGNATGLHYHVELCQKITQELCCEHEEVTVHKCCEAPPQPQHGHCPHECREDVSGSAISVFALGEVSLKPFLRAVGFVILPSIYKLEKRTLEKLGSTDTGPPPQVDLIRDTVRLL